MKIAKDKGAILTKYLFLINNLLVEQLFLEVELVVHERIPRLPQLPTLTQWKDSHLCFVLSAAAGVAVVATKKTYTK